MSHWIMLFCIPLSILLLEFVVLRWVLYPAIMRFILGNNLPEKDPSVIPEYLKASKAIRYSKTFLLSCISSLIGMLVVFLLLRDMFYKEISIDKTMIVVSSICIAPAFFFSLFVFNRHLKMQIADRIEGNTPRHYLSLWTFLFLPLCVFFTAGLHWYTILKLLELIEDV